MTRSRATTNSLTQGTSLWFLSVRESSVRVSARFNLWIIVTQNLCAGLIMPADANFILKPIAGVRMVHATPGELSSPLSVNLLFIAFAYLDAPLIKFHRPVDRTLGGDVQDWHFC